MRISDSRQFPTHNLFPQRIKPAKNCKLELLVDVVSRGFLGTASVLCAKIEKRCLLGSVFAQYGHFVHAICRKLLLFSLIPALCFVTLSLLPCVFLLALGKC
jgi:hypothetical protein